MLRAGMIRKLAAGLYTWSPLGLRVLRKVEAVVREEMDRAGAIELQLPTIQPKELWEEAGRWEKFNGQLLSSTDRRDRFAGELRGGTGLRDRRHAVNASPAALRIEYRPDDGTWQVRKCRGAQPPATALRLTH